jgi:hypothetical protein
MLSSSDEEEFPRFAVISSLPKLTLGDTVVRLRVTTAEEVIPLLKESILVNQNAQILFAGINPEHCT